VIDPPAALRDAALVLFSGGQDSATCLAWALTHFARVETIGFDYGQRHHAELAARQVLRKGMAALNPIWAARLGDDHVVDLTGFGAIGATAMTEATAIETAANGLPNTFVPGRNLIFLVTAAALGVRRGIGVLVGGMCETDFSGYPDCRQTTMDAMAAALGLGLDRSVVIETPLMRRSKADTWRLTDQLGGDRLVDLIRRHSHSCYLNDHHTLHEWGYGCGSCPACDLRAKGWAGYRAG